MIPTDQDELVWKALADGTRRRALDLLHRGPMTTGELCLALCAPTSPPAARLGRTGALKHLAILQHAGLISVRGEGRLRWNYVNLAPIQKVCERWIGRHLRPLASSLNKLKDHIESPVERGAALPAPPAATGRSRAARSRTLGSATERRSSPAANRLAASPTPENHS